MKINVNIIAILVTVVLIGGVAILSGRNNNQTTETKLVASNVSVVDGKQIVTINAKGGYSPNITTAKADLPTILKVATNGTFDCSSALTIPSLGINKNLPPSGETGIEVPPQKAGTTMRGLCAMGMYNFAVNFN